eukprot:SAG22_NODE_18464_length_287_cov_0.414894_1_plen_47_part_10
MAKPFAQALAAFFRTRWCSSFTIRSSMMDFSVFCESAPSFSQCLPAL